MKLFVIDTQTNQINLNKEWMFLVPEFKALIRRDKGMSVKQAGKSVHVHTQCLKECTFIYFYTDFGSPIYDYEDAERRKEALYYANLDESALDKAVLAAVNKYEELMLKGARSLRTYRALLKMLDAMDDYMENLDFTEKTRTGELVNNPERIASTVSKMDGVHTSVENFRKRVDTELKQQGSIRGTATLGDNENKKTATWSEQDIANGSNHAAEGTNNASIQSGRSMDHLMRKLQKVPVNFSSIQDED